MTAQSFGAVFAEVAVDKDTHMVEVRRVVATYDIGTLMNEKTGMNQLVGGIVWGRGVCADGGNRHRQHVWAHREREPGGVSRAGECGYSDDRCDGAGDSGYEVQSAGGPRGIGEIGITGAMAAVANAVYNATGKRVREYPVTPDKIMLARA